MFGFCVVGEKKREQVDTESLNSYLFEEVHQVYVNNPTSSLNILVLVEVAMVEMFVYRPDESMFGFYKVFLGPRSCWF